MVEGDKSVKFCQHIGGAHFITVTSDYPCVDLRKWYQTYPSNDNSIRPTEKGLSLRLDEWDHLCSLIDVINSAYPSLSSAQPCYYDDDIVGWLYCTECNPFLINLSQPHVYNV